MDDAADPRHQAVQKRRSRFARIFWQDGGVHQNLTFPVQPDFISGQHCWHQKVRVTKPGAEDKYGDIFVDTDKAHEV